MAARAQPVEGATPTQPTARYAEAIKARKVEVIGYHGGALLSDGTRLSESAAIGEQRAAMLKRMLLHAGVKESALHVRSEASAAADGIDDYELRSGAIIVTP